VISAALLFYVLTIVGMIRLRFTQPSVERPYRTFGYPFVPAIYIIGATTILIVLLVYKPATTWPGFAIVLLGLPVYYLARMRKRA
jgi:APA family basic amino acid/polyamine antiporter